MKLTGLSSPLIIPLACAGLACAGLVSAEEPSAAGATGLAGEWTFNKDLSDNAQQKMRDNMDRGGRRQPGGFRPPAGGAGGPGGPGGGPPMGRGPGGDGGPAGMRGLFEPAESLTITVQGDEIVIAEAYGQTRRLHADGKTYKTENGLAELKTRWDDAQLRIETKRGRGGKVEETWRASPEGNRIEIEVKLEGGFGPDLKLRRVYDRAPSEGER